jgi:hypothetical protein
MLNYQGTATSWINFKELQTTQGLNFTFLQYMQGLTCQPHKLCGQVGPRRMLQLGETEGISSYVKLEVVAPCC